MKLYLARHGQTDMNITRILQGRTNGMLTELGIKQSQRLGNYFRDKELETIHCSNLQRSFDTAMTVSNATGVILVPEASLVERNLGTLEGKSWDDYFAAQKESGESHLTFRPEDGESLQDMHVRIKPFLEYVTKDPDAGDLLIVGHGGINTVILDILLPDTIEDIWLTGQSNACINILEIKGLLKAEAVILNYTEHLESLNGDDQ